MQISTRPLTYTIVRRDHTSFKFRAGPRVWTHSRQLRAAIEREITQRVLPETIAQFEQGNPVFFGGLSVGKEGISGWFERIPWSEITDVQMRQGELVVLKTDHRQQRLQFSAGTPNLFVLIALVKHILNTQQAAS